MFTSEVIKGLMEVLSNMSNPNLPVKSIDALVGEVQFVNGVVYSLTTGQRIK